MSENIKYYVDFDNLADYDQRHGYNELFDTLKEAKEAVKDAMTSWATCQHGEIDYLKYSAIWPICHEIGMKDIVCTKPIVEKVLQELRDRQSQNKKSRRASKYRDYLRLKKEFEEKQDEDV